MYRKNINNWDYLLFLFVVAIITACALFMFGCSSYTSKINKLHPETSKDTLGAAKYCNNLFPIDTTYRVGKVIVKPNNNDYFAAVVDSLKREADNAKANTQTIYKDTCQSANYQWEQGYNFGYDLGLYQGKKSCPPSTERVDTLIIKDTVGMTILRLQRDALNNELLKVISQSQEWEAKANIRFWILMSILLLFVGGGIGYLYKKGTLKNLLK